MGYEARDSIIIVRITEEELKDIGAFNSYYHDSLGFGHPVLFQDTLTALPIDHPILLIKPDELQTPFILFPGDTVDVKINSKTRRTYLTSTNVRRQNELAVLDLITDKTGSIFPAFVNRMVWKAKNLNEYKRGLIEVDSLRKTRKKLLEEYTQENEISDEVFQFTDMIIDDAAWLDSLSMIRINKNYGYVSSDALNEKLKNWNGVFTERPRQAVKGYADIGSALVELGTGLKYIDTGKQLISKIRYSLDNFSGEAKVFFAERFLKEAISKKIQLSESEKAELSQVIGGTASAALLSKLTDPTEKEIHAQEDRVISINDSMPQDLETILKSLHGKVVLVDFWASWCLPCIAEFPSGKRLSEKLGKNDFQMIYLSIDEDQHNWKKSTVMHLRDATMSFLLLDGDLSPIAKTYNIKTIPRYILINKEGKVANENSFRPSDERLEKVIEELIGI